MAQSYLIDEAQFARLQRVEIALHGDGTQLTPDARRDLANSLSQLRSEILSQPWCDVPGGEEDGQA